MNNSEYERQFTSTGEKLFRHPEALRRFREEGKATPIVMHIMPTSECNLKCSFCSVKDRIHHETIGLDDIILPTVDFLKSLGLKAAIFSGGGEPTIYHDFERMVNEIHSRGIEMGMITNGTLLHKQSISVLEKFKWIRVSINSLDYLPKIRLPQLKNPTIGFSYIVTDRDTTTEGLLRIRDLARRMAVEYVRLLPDCAQPLDKLLAKHEEVAALSKSLGAPFFHQFKVHKTPEFCFLGYFHPVLYCDGNVYPCDSLVLNDFENQQFKAKFALCRYDRISELYQQPVRTLVDPKKMCPNCVFARQNTLLQAVLEGAPIREVSEIKHENFI
jgi:MoaA/NifB/PqqE/SkfB family radical SAM enzyme